MFQMIQIYIINAHDVVTTTSVVNLGVSSVTIYHIRHHKDIAVINSLGYIASILLW